MNESASKENKPQTATRLSGERINELKARLGREWEVLEEHHLQKTFLFKNFRQALEFTNRIGEIAEAANHHPDIFLTWGKVRVTIYTHSVDGLTEKDFALAERIEG